MLQASVTVDESKAAPFRFVKPPKLGDRIGISRSGTRLLAIITGLRMEHGPDGRGTLLVTARSS